MQHFEYKALHFDRAFIFLHKKIPPKNGGCSGACRSCQNESAAVKTYLGIFTQHYNTSITKPLSNQNEVRIADVIATSQ